MSAVLWAFAGLVIATSVSAADVWSPQVDNDELVRSWNGMHGFVLDSNDVPIVAHYNNDEILVVKRFDGDAWINLPQVGPGAVYGSTSLKIDSVDTLYISYFSKGNIQIDEYGYEEYDYVFNIKKFNGDTWVSVGDASNNSIFADVHSQSATLAIDNEDAPYLVFADGIHDDRISVAKYDDSWSLIGEGGFSGAEIYWPTLTFDGGNIPYVAYLDDGANGRVTLEAFDGLRWYTIGERGFSDENTNFLSPLNVDSEGIVYVQYTTLDFDYDEEFITSQIVIDRIKDGTLEKVSTYTKSGESFSDILLYGSLALDSENTPYISYGSYNGITIAKLTGGEWEILGGEGSIENTSLITPIAIASDDTPIIATTVEGERWFEDRIAIQKLETGVLCRFYSAEFRGHFYTDSTTECALIKEDANWDYEGTAYKTLSANAVGATPVYRFWSEGYNHHFYTTSESEKAGIIANDPNWTYEGIGYYVYGAQQDNTKTVYRFWSEAYKAHFYTASASEKESLMTHDDNWAYEGIAWYVAK